MSCGFWLRVNNYWLPIEGVQSGVGYGFERARDGFSSVAGVAHAQEALRAVRSWSVNFGEQVGPETVAALMMAAQQDAGDVMLWDEAAARANLLDPVAVGAREGYPVMLCDGMPVISLTSASGEDEPTTVREVPLKANARIASTSGNTVAQIETSATHDALVKVSVPDAPVGTVLAKAELVLTRRFAEAGEGTVTVKHASNAWTEPYGVSSTGYWASVPGGATAGSAASAPVTVVELSGVAAFQGADMSLRLSQSVGVSGFVARSSAADVPILRLTYSVPPKDRIIRQHLRAGSYWLTYWTNAAAGTQVGTLAADGASLPLITGAGLGLRRISVDLSAATELADRDWTITIDDSSTYLLGGLMLTDVPPTHYLPGHKTPVRVTVDDPSLDLGSLYPGEQGKGQRGTTIREVG